MGRSLLELSRAGRAEQLSHRCRSETKASDLLLASQEVVNIPAQLGFNASECFQAVHYFVRFGRAKRFQKVNNLGFLHTLRQIKFLEHPQTIKGVQNLHDLLCATQR